VVSFVQYLGRVIRGFCELVKNNATPTGHNATMTNHTLANDNDRFSTSATNHLRATSKKEGY